LQGVLDYRGGPESIALGLQDKVHLVLGTASSPQRTHPPARADALGEIVLKDHDGHDVRLADLWRDGPVALIFLRHYG
jgi:hypothetical protein